MGCCKCKVPVKDSMQIKTVISSYYDLDLISVEENNQQAYKLITGPVTTGIACPKCGTELVNPQPSMVLTSYPVQIYVDCPSSKCDYSGTVFI